MDSPNPRLVEVLKVWYSLFCVIVDGYESGEMTTLSMIEKVVKLRKELRDAMPEVEALVNGRKQ